MDDNPAYGMTQRDFTIQSLADHGPTRYEYVRTKGNTVVVQGKSRARRSPRVCVAIGIVATTAVLALVVAIVAVVLNPVLNSSQQVDSLEMEVEGLQLSLNETVKEIRVTVREHTELLHKLTLGSITNPARSCSEILPVHSVSGEYWIQTSNTKTSPVQVYCDMTRSCCNTTGGWMRVANIVMTDPSQQCPDGFRLVTRTTAPLRTCGRPGPAGCVSTTFPVHGIKYSQVCGRVIGYQDKSPDAFESYSENRSATIDSNYVDGVIITHGRSPRQHIWTFAAALSETRLIQRFVCPCTQSDTFDTGVVPPFIGQDYFCETGTRNDFEYIFYSEDPLWNGQGCGGTSTCCSFNNPPWFCKQLPQPTTDDIELRLCGDQHIDDEDTPLETVEIYVK